jgi:hypothetical protein
VVEATDIDGRSSSMLMVTACPDATGDMVGTMLLCE